MSTVQKNRRIKLTQPISPSNEKDLGAKRSAKYLVKVEEYREAMDYEYTEAQEAISALGFFPSQNRFYEDDHQSNEMYWVNRGMSRDVLSSL